MSNETRVKRSYYYADYNEFLNASEEAILGELTDSHMPLTLTVQQEQAWKEEIRILKQVMRDLGDGHVAFEYTIPRMGKRIDAVIIKQGHVFLLEFKVFETEYPKTAVDQVVDYALDLHNFQEELTIFLQMMQTTLKNSIKNNLLHNIIIIFIHN